MRIGLIDPMTSKRAALELEEELVDAYDTMDIRRAITGVYTICHTI
jgi:hypothetical protein